MAREGHLTAVGLASDGGDGWFSVMPRPTSRRIAEVRRGEWHRALDALNVPIGRRFELGLPDGTLRDHEDDVTEWVSNLLRQLSPSQIFVPRPLDPHPDHRALAKATLRSVIDVYGSVSDRGPGGGESFLGQRSSTLPEVYSYRVYPGEGLWPAGRPSEPTLLPTLLQLARSASGLIARPPLVLRAAKSKPDKKAAINAHESQRTLLDGELRYVWRTGVELYWKMSASSDSTATHP
jgi:LmbE family N-acetylglucosaminyl deacetylase